MGRVRVGRIKSRLVVNQKGKEKAVKAKKESKEKAESSPGSRTEKAILQPGLVVGKAKGETKPRRESSKATAVVVASGAKRKLIAGIGRCQQESQSFL